VPCPQATDGRCDLGADKLLTQGPLTSPCHKASPFTAVHLFLCWSSSKEQAHPPPHRGKHLFSALEIDMPSAISQSLSVQLLTLLLCPGFSVLSGFGHGNQLMGNATRGPWGTSGLAPASNKEPHGCSLPTHHLVGWRGESEGKAKTA